MVSNRSFSILIDGLTITGAIFYPETGTTPPPVLCLCHGIPAAIPTPGDPGYPALAERFAREGFMTCIFNFRGCGDSEGNLDLLDWTRDLHEIITFLYEHKDSDKTRINLMGFSGGAAAASYVAAADERVSALVLCACPAQFSIGALGRNPEEFLEQCRKVGTIRDAGFPPSLDEWTQHFRDVSPIDYVDKISPRPLLIIHGDDDETIPLRHASELFAMAKEPRKLIVIPGGSHRLKTNQQAMESAAAWLKQTNRIT